MEQTKTLNCDHRPTWIGQLAVAACAACGSVDWVGSAGSVDPSEAMAYLFGTYDLIGELDAVGAPGRSALVYRPNSAKKARNLRAFPANVWLRCGPRLWLSHDESNLVLSSDQELMIENLTRGA